MVVELQFFSLDDLFLVTHFPVKGFDVNKNSCLLETDSSFSEMDCAFWVMDCAYVVHVFLEKEIVYIAKEKGSDVFLVKDFFSAVVMGTSDEENASLEIDASVKESVCDDVEIVTF